MGLGNEWTSWINFVPSLASFAGASGNVNVAQLSAADKWQLQDSFAEMVVGGEIRRGWCLWAQVERSTVSWGGASDIVPHLQLQHKESFSAIGDGALQARSEPAVLPAVLQDRLLRLEG